MPVSTSPLLARRPPTTASLLARLARLCVLALVVSVILGSAPASVAQSPVGPASALKQFPNCTGSPFFAFKTMLLFTVDCPVSNSTLWRIDNSTADPVQVTSLVSNKDSSYAQYMIAADTQLFFWSRTSTNFQLWRTDGTAQGTLLLKAFPDDTFVMQETIGDTLYAVVYTGPNNASAALWKSDGSVAGTLLVKDLLLPTSTSSLSLDPQITPPPLPQVVWDVSKVGNRIFASVYALGGRLPLTLPTAPYNLWRSDGTPESTVIVAQFHWEAAPKLLMAFRGKLLFDTSNQLLLAQSDGTSPEIVLPNLSELSGRNIVGDYILFSKPRSDGGFDLWRTNGTMRCSVQIKGFAPSQQLNRSQSGRGVFSFITSNSSTGALTLWKSDGTAAGTVALKEPLSNEGLVNDILFLPNGGMIIFVLKIDGRENTLQSLILWYSDGTPEGTTQIQAPIPTTPLFGAGGTVFDNAVYFWVSDRPTPGQVGPISSGASLWRLPLQTLANPAHPSTTFATPAQTYRLFLPFIDDEC